MPAFETPLPFRPNRSVVWPESFYNLRVDGLPIRSDSTQRLQDTHDFHASLPTNPHTHVRFGPFGLNAWNTGAQAGYFVDVLPANLSTAFNSTARRTWTALNPNSQHPGKHLYFSDLRQQGATRNPLTGQYTILPVFVQGDKHSLMWTQDSRELVESISYRGDRPESSHATTFITDDYEMPLGADGVRKAGANAPRIPIGPLYFTWQDLVDCGTTGDLGHMVGFVMEDGDSSEVWPARANDFTRTTGLAEGMILRLRADFDESVFTRLEMRALARTLKRYGMIVFDRSPLMRITAPSDPQWPSDVANGSAWGTNVGILDFEVVDVSSVKVDPFTRRYPLEPPPGKVRIGLAREGHRPGESVQTKHEIPTGKPIGMHRRYLSWESRLNVVSELEIASKAGRSVHISFKTPSWQGVANGNHDAELNALFTAIRDTYVCCWVTFYHEPEENVNGSDLTAASWRAMQLRCEERRVAVGATNCVIVPVLMDNTFTDRNPADWVIEDTDKFPIYGIDLYTNVYATSPLNLRNNSKFNTIIEYLTSRGIDVCFPEIGGGINTTNVREADCWRALVNEALDPDNRIKALCWFDVEPIPGAISGVNRLGGPLDPTGNLLAAFQTSLTATYSYRGGGWRGNPTGVIDSIRVTDTTPEVGVPEVGEQTIRRKVAGTWNTFTLKRRVNGVWVNQTVKRITE